MKKILFDHLINTLSKREQNNLKKLLIQTYKIPKDKFSFDNPKIQNLAISHMLKSYSIEDIEGLVASIQSFNTYISPNKIIQTIKKYNTI